MKTDTRATIHNSPFFSAFYTYKPTPDWNITLGADNFTSWRFELQQVNYIGPRNLGQVSNIQDVLTRTQPRFYLNLRKTF